MYVFWNSYEGDDLEFDIIGIHPGIANAFRRIMISDIPSMAVEKVIIANNTSVIPDEILAHRLGLVPLKADARQFSFPQGDILTESNEDKILEYELKVRCSSAKGDYNYLSFDEKYVNHKVYSNQIKWIPKGQQAKKFSEMSVSCVHDDIIICKMRPGHEIDVRLLAVKGIGRDHIKFSPVATATYRLLPVIRINREITGKDALLLQKCFSPGVIGIDQQDKAYVVNARYDMCSRNVYRYPHLADSVDMARVRDHYIFTVESVGAYKPHEIFIEAVKILKEKCKKFLIEIDSL